MLLPVYKDWSETKVTQKWPFYDPFWPFFSICKFIFHKTEVQTVSLRGLTLKGAGFHLWSVFIMRGFCSIFIFWEKVKPIWLTSCELSTNNLGVVSLICGGASDPIRISTRLGNRNANFDRIEKQLLKSRYLRFMPCFCSQHKVLRYFKWVTKRSDLKMNLTPSNSDQSSWINNHYFFHLRHIRNFFIKNNPEIPFILWKYLIFPKIITAVVIIDLT